jgi:2-methylcitrate dehydratase PrpD
MADEITPLENRGATRALAKYVSTSRGGDIPAKVRETARLLLLDQLGCQIAGVQLPWSERVYEAIRPLSPVGKSTLVGHSEQLGPDAAAFLNSAMGHSNESDDTHLKSPTHPGAVIIPAAFAVAEDVGASGAQLLEAIVIGYEVMLRVSQSVSPGLVAQGHHPPPAVGPFGAASAASRLLGMSEDQTLNALASLEATRQASRNIRKLGDPSKDSTVPFLLKLASVQRSWHEVASRDPRVFLKVLEVFVACSRRRRTLVG